MGNLKYTLLAAPDAHQRNHDVGIPPASKIVKHMYPCVEWNNLKLQGNTNHLSPTRNDLYPSDWYKFWGSETLPQKYLEITGHSMAPPPRSKGSWWVPPLEALPCRPHTPHLRVLYPGKVEDATATLSWPCAWCMCSFDVQIFSSSNQVKTITLQGTNISCWQKENHLHMLLYFPGGYIKTVEIEITGWKFVYEYDSLDNKGQSKFRVLPIALKNFVHSQAFQEVIMSPHHPNLSWQPVSRKQPAPKQAVLTTPQALKAGPVLRRLQACEVTVPQGDIHDDHCRAFHRAQLVLVAGGVHHKCFWLDLM